MGNKTMEKRVRIINPEYKVKLYAGRKNNKGVEYDIDSLTNILTSGIFDMVSIPVYAYRDEFLTLNPKNNPDPKGVNHVGYINAFDEIYGVFTVSIFEKYSSDVNQEDMVIYPRVLIDRASKKVVKIVQFDICRSKRY